MGLFKNPGIEITELCGPKDEPTDMRWEDPNDFFNSPEGLERARQADRSLVELVRLLDTADIAEKREV